MTALRYGLAASLPLSYDEAVQQVRDALQSEGFGILTEIDVKKTLREKLGADFQRYIILGACNPSIAFSSLQKEQEIGLLLPCNVVVHEEGEGSRVSIFDPLVMLKVTGNEDLREEAESARQKLERALDRLRRG